MLLIVGAEQGTHCEDWQVRDLESERCLWEAEPFEPSTYWSASLFPEVQALCEFDAERRRLGLPTLEDGVMQ